MCSLQEAWNDFSLTKSAQNTNDNMKMVRDQQISMDMQKNQNNMHHQRQQMDREITSHQFDRIPEQGYYTQSDNRRQFAQQQADVFRPEYEQHLMAKPPAGNSHGDTIRGVHNKFTRTKRVPTMTGGNEMLNLTSNVQQPGALATTLNEIPKYVREAGVVEGKPYREGPSNGAKPLEDNGPIAHNMDDVADAFVSVDAEYFANNSMMMTMPMNNENNMLANNNIQTNVIQSNNLEVNNGINNGINNEVTMEMKKNDDNMEQIKQLKAQIQALNSKINVLENKLQNVENNRPHDIILIIVIALFVLFIVDNVFKLGFNK